MQARATNGCRRSCPFPSPTCNSSFVADSTYLQLPSVPRLYELLFTGLTWMCVASQTRCAVSIVGRILLLMSPWSLPFPASKTSYSETIVIRDVRLLEQHKNNSLRLAPKDPLSRPSNHMRPNRIFLPSYSLTQWEGTNKFGEVLIRHTWLLDFHLVVAIS